MSYNNFYQTAQNNKDGLAYSGSCAISPILSSLQEVILLYLGDMAFYLLELKKVGVKNVQLNNNVIDVISSLIIGIDYTPDQFNKIISKVYVDLIQTKSMYRELCARKTIDKCNLNFKKMKQVGYSQAIKEGEKHKKLKHQKYTEHEKHLLASFLMIIKSICINLVELTGYGCDETEAYYSILEMLKLMNNPQELLKEKEKEQMERFTNLDHSLIQEICEKRKERYGTITTAEVSFSTRPNRAILVSGTNLRELELILKAAAKNGIDVYTHGKMIIAHAYPKLRAYSNLVGHYGKGPSYGLVDFAAFPGAVFLTKLSMQRIEKLYRGRVYTTDSIAPAGASIIYGENFNPLIESALLAKGFVTVQQKPPIKIGYDEEEVIKKITEVAEKMERGEIKHFFAIGVSNDTKAQREYFERFLQLVPNDCFVLSFSYSKKSDNVLFLPYEFDISITYRAIEILTKKIPVSDLKMSILFTRCELHTISNLLNIKFMGFNDIYFPTCSPNLVNPAMIDDIKETYNIKSYSDPQADLHSMLSGK